MGAQLTLSGIAWEIRYHEWEELSTSRVGRRVQRELILKTGYALWREK